MTVAMIFPGQGAHSSGMASAWQDHPAFSTFAEVGEVAGLPDLAELADDPEACAATAVAQPAVYAVSIAAWRALTDAGVEPDMVAGHSLGEFAAAVAAGVLSVKDGAAVVAERGRAMADAISDKAGAMMAILKLDLDEVEEVVSDFPDVMVANDNAPGQVVISGPGEAVEEAAEACRDRGGTVSELEVEGAFHTEAMRPAVERLDEELGRHELSDPTIPLIQGVSAEAATTAEEVRRGLVDGTLSRVRWREVLEVIADRGATHLIEAGPGGVLRGLARRTVPDLEAISVAAPDAVDDVREALDLPSEG